MSKEKLFEEYKGIAYYLAGKFIRKYGPILYQHRDDIHQEAILALLEAIENKDRIKGSFTTYIYNTVHNNLKRLMMETFKHKNLYLEDIDINLGYDIDFRFLLDLTEEEVQLFQYHFIEGNPIKETAKHFKMRWEDCNGALAIIKTKVIDAIHNG